MAIAWDAAAELETGLAPTSPQTWTHTPVGTPKGVVVAIVQGTGAGNVSDTDYIAGVTYGGVALTRIVRATDSATERGAADLWFVGSGIGTGAKTVSVTFNATTVPRFHFVSMTFTAGANTELVDSDFINGDTTDPSVTLAYAGRTCLSVAALFTGDPDPAALVPNADCTVVHTYDMGAASSVVLRQTTPGATDFTIGGTLGLDDAAYAAAAFSEVVTPPASTSAAGSATLPLGTETTGGTITIPGTVASGDDLFVLVTSRDHDGATASPTCTDNDTTGNAFALYGTVGARKGSLFWKKATADTASKTITIAGTIGSCSAGVTAFRNAYAADNPITNWTTFTSSGGGGTLAGFTPDYANSEICLAVFNLDNLTCSNMAAVNPGTLTEHFQCYSTGGNDSAVAFASKAQTGGLTGTGNFSWTQTAGTTHGMIWAIRPSASTATSTSSTSLQNPVWIYASAGTYTVSLIVTDNDGNRSSMTTAAVHVS